MNCRTLCVLVALGGLLGGAGAASAQAVPETTGEQADRALLYRLTRQLRRVDRDTEELMDRAMAEARDNGGAAETETKAKLLSLRDERDRIFSRMLILSMRHGWEIPDLDKPSVTKSSRQEAEDSVFGAVDELVRRQFSREAQRIAAQVRLPVVSLASLKE